MNWTGAPDREPLWFRASMRLSLWRYRIVPLRHASFAMDGGVFVNVIDGPPNCTIPLRIDTLLVSDGHSRSFFTPWEMSYEEAAGTSARLQGWSERAQPNTSEMVR